MPIKDVIDPQQLAQSSCNKIRERPVFRKLILDAQADEQPLIGLECLEECQVQMDYDLEEIAYWFRWVGVTN
jgi:hypothetical protein